jgi:hypothetical protein
LGKALGAVTLLKCSIRAQFVQLEAFAVEMSAFVSSAQISLFSVQKDKYDTI